MTQFEKIKTEKIDHLVHILFNLIAERILKCPKCGYPYKEGYICDNCGADNSDNEEEYPLDELIDTMQAEPVSEGLEEEITRYFSKNPIKYLTDWPATKEQRDLLFAKMKEAGYEWDAEKKELKKIHVIDEGKAEMDYCFTKMMKGEKVTPAWSAKDEKMLKETLALIETVEDINKVKDGFLDVKMWLKSLKDRYTWKPSDEQMKALNSAIHCYAGISPTNNREVYALKIMEEQLKKLRED